MTKQINIGVLGGAFDPLHVGHMQIAEFVINNIMNSYLRPDHIMIMPCFKHMYDKEMVSAKHRFNMCCLAAKHHEHLVVSDYEIKRQLPGDFYTLVNTLTKDPEFKHCHFYFIIGADNALTFDKWYKYKWLQKNAKFIIVPRKGCNITDNKNLWFRQQPHIDLTGLENNITEVSSTEVRNIFKNKVPGAVACCHE